MNSIEMLNKIHRDYSYTYSRDLITKEEYIDFISFYNEVTQMYKDKSYT